MGSISWETYYGRFYDWAAGTQVSRLSDLSSLGPADQVAEIIIELHYADAAAADRLLKKAVDANLAFRWDDLEEFLYINDKALAAAACVNSAGRLFSEHSASKVAEIIEEVHFSDAAASNRLLKKAVDAGLRFSGEELGGFWSSNDRALAKEATQRSAERLTSKDIDELCDLADDATIRQISREHQIPLPDHMPKEEPVAPAPQAAEETKPVRPGLFGSIAALFVMDKATKAVENRLKRGLFNTGRGRKCDGDCAHCPPHYGYRYGRWYYGHDHTGGCEFGGNRGGGGIT